MIAVDNQAHKKVVGFLDFVLMLALIRSYLNNGPFQFNSPTDFSEPPNHSQLGVSYIAHYPHQYDNFNIRTKLGTPDDDLFSSYQSIMDDAHSRIPASYVINQSTVTSPHNPVTMMFKVNYNRTTQLFEQQHRDLAHQGTVSPLSCFDDDGLLDIGNTTSPNSLCDLNLQNNDTAITINNNNITTATSSTHFEEEFTNLDDVRWQDFLTDDTRLTPLPFNNDPYSSLCEARGPRTSSTSTWYDPNSELQCSPDAASFEVAEADFSFDSSTFSDTPDSINDADLLNCNEIDVFDASASMLGDSDTISSELPHLVVTAECFESDQLMSPSLSAQTSSLSLADRPHHNSLPPLDDADDDNNLDLMSLIHEQDADLGVDWRSFSGQHKKDGKSVDNDFDNWPKKTEAPQYTIDGETGEKLLQPRKHEQQQQQRQPNTVSAIAPPNNVHVAPHRQQPQRPSFGDGYLDELNDILKSPDNIQQKNFSFEAPLSNNAVLGNNGIPNAHLVEPMGTDNGIPEYDEDIWQDIASLTDFSDMSFTTETNEQQQQQPEPATMMQQQQSINTNGYERMVGSVQQQPATFFGMQQQHNMYNTSPMFAQYDPYGTTQQSMDCSPAMLDNNHQKATQQQHNGFQQNVTSPCQPFNCQPQQPYFGSYNNNTNQQQQPASNMFNSDFHRPLAQQPQHAAVQQQHHMLRQQQQQVSPLNIPMATNLNTNNTTVGFSKPAGGGLNYSSEPGGLFFEPHFNFSAGRNVELNQQQHHTQQMESSTPQLTTLGAKDYNNSTTLNSADNRALVKSESYESDSGVSMELSPQRFNFGPSRDSPNMTFLQNEIKTESITDMPSLNGDLSRELKGVKHNHTYYGNGTKTRVSKKPVLNLSRESRDEKRARELGVPFTLDEIILTPVEEYNDMLTRAQLTPEQQALIKDIRRRGKNKVAAQNCRKRKVETISNMEEDVDMLRNKKMELSEERSRLEMRANQMKHKYETLYKQVFATLRNDRDEPLDPAKYRLEVVEGTLFILPGQQDSGSKMQGSGPARSSGGQMMGRHHHQDVGDHSSGSSSSSMSNIDFNKVKLEMIDQ